MPKRSSKPYDANATAFSIVQAVTGAQPEFKVQPPEKNPAAVALHFMQYNFCRVHQTLRCTPAMQAGLTNHIWELSEVIALMNDPQKKAA